MIDNIAASSAGAAFELNDLRNQTRVIKQNRRASGEQRQGIQVDLGTCEIARPVGDAVRSEGVRNPSARISVTPDKIAAIAAKHPHNVLDHFGR